MGSSESPTTMSRKPAPTTATSLLPLFMFNKLGDVERCALRPSNGRSADGWQRSSGVLERGSPLRVTVKQLCFRANAAFTAAKSTSFLKPSAPATQFSFRPTGFRGTGSKTCSGHEPRALRDLPDGRGNGVAADVHRHPVVDRSDADTTRPGKGTRISVPFAGTAGFNRLLFTLGTVFRCPSRSTAPFWSRKRRGLWRRSLSACSIFVIGLDYLFAERSDPMTVYNDFIYDLSARCGEVLKFAYDLAKANDREVTLLVMTATAAFLVPFERLRGGMTIEHQGGDRKRFPELARHLDSALGRPFLDSPFHDGDSSSWSIGKVPRMDQEAFLDPEPLPRTTPAGQVFGIIRNALAHGNLWTGPPRIGSQIEGLVLWSDDRDKNNVVVGYKYIYVSPNDFRSFLHKWFIFLKFPDELVYNLHGFSPMGAITETLAIAADMADLSSQRLHSRTSLRSSSRSASNVSRRA
jgi:hypothetical protein